MIAVGTRSSVSVGDAVRATVGVLAILAVVAALWWAQTMVLLLFFGILLAVLLDGSSRSLTRWSGLPKPASLTVVVATIGLCVVSVGWSTGPVLLAQIHQLGHTVVESVSDLSQAPSEVTLRSLPSTFDWTKILEHLPSPLGIATGATALASAVFRVITSLLIVLFFGIYFALDPDTYVDLIIRLAPPGRRSEASAMLSDIGLKLHRWLRGQLLAMAAVGAMTYVGLLLLGMPLAFVLALLLGLFEFVPYVGPIMGVVPMLIIAAGQDLSLVFSVAALYVVVQFLESYVLTPLIQSRAVSLPPAVVLLSQLILGTIFGVLGLALATPLLAAAAVPFRRALREQGDSKGQPIAEGAEIRRHR